MPAKQAKPKKRARSSRLVVESRSYPEGSYQREYVKCGKRKCSCARTPTHGPYWYLYQWQPATAARTARLRSIYIGKALKRRIG